MQKKSNHRSSSANNTMQNNHGMESSQLMKLFEDELKDIYWAEKALLKALPKMAKKATAEELVDAIQHHLGETEQHVKRCEEVFNVLGKKPVAKKCEAMDGLIKEAEELMKTSDPGSMCDAAIISAAQKVEHYEIASYGTLRAFAELMDLNEAAELLSETLEEEKAADEKLTQVAMSAVNLHAVMEDDDDSKHSS